MDSAHQSTQAVQNAIIHAGCDIVRREHTTGDRKFAGKPVSNLGAPPGMLLLESRNLCKHRCVIFNKEARVAVSPWFF